MSKFHRHTSGKSNLDSEARAHQTYVVRRDIIVANATTTSTATPTTTAAAAVANTTSYEDIILTDHRALQNTRYYHVEVKRRSIVKASLDELDDANFLVAAQLMYSQ